MNIAEMFFEVEGSIGITDFLDLLLQLRGDNPATVRDVVDACNYLGWRVDKALEEERKQHQGGGTGGEPSSDAAPSLEMATTPAGQQPPPQDPIYRMLDDVAEGQKRLEMRLDELQGL